MNLKRILETSAASAAATIVVVMFSICLFSCSNSLGPDTNKEKEGKSAFAGTALDEPAEPLDKLIKAVEKLTASTSGGAVMGWMVALIATINAWQLKQFYTLNREIGEVNARIGRIASDTESEKVTRNRVNSLILRRLGVTDEVAEETMREPPGK